MSRDLRFERLIDARPERVFDAFTTPEGQHEFYGQDAPGWIVESRCDLRVGGVWSIAFGPSPSELYRHRHVFDEIDRPRRIRLTSTETRLDGSSFEFTFEALYMSMSLDGFITGPGDDADHGLGIGGERLHDWLGESDRGPSGFRLSGPNGQIFDELMATGAVVVGRRTFDHAGRWKRSPRRSDLRPDPAGEPRPRPRPNGSTT